VADCLFCRIASREVPSREVLSDGDLYAFEDINPQAPVHVLVVPRQHIATLNDLTPEDDALVGRLIRTAARIARERNIAEPGYRVVLNCNAHAGQSVWHLHLHLLGGRNLHWPPASTHPVAMNDGLPASAALASPARTRP
jgi:histidine triad (HIT) family protein